MIMEDLNTTVRVSGFVLSSLMFQHFNSDSDAEGFIIGESIGEEKNSITDSQIEHIQFEHTINIQKHVCCHKPNSFYNSVGDVNPDDLRRILSNYKEENVIGWYRQRRNSSQQMTFREQTVHQNLKKFLANEELLFLLLTPSEATVSGSTHRLEYSVYQSLGRQLYSVPVHVSNLGILEQHDYWRISATCAALSQSQAIKKHRSKFFACDGTLDEVETVSSMNDTLLEELKAASEKVEKTEKLVEKLQTEVSALRKQISKKNQKRVFELSAPEEPEENVLLCESLRTLFPSRPLLRTQTLTRQGSPVPELCCSVPHNINVPETLPFIFSYHQAQERKRKSASYTKPFGKRPPSELLESRRKKRSTTGGERSFSDSEADTEEEFVTSQNGNLDVSNSPVF
ncbi:BRCA1-A complex subunit Abraxas 1 [Denticeps clupeoides]|uniref:BRCA1-A complex subunit Abraxas 1 n=1 Tax=Denticeps clupeoides TaxID=299321 RepID=A0AAY4BQY4_9TELE|nr:BRCA1-A complex subunit Abraxas 1 [Denticeps clupeoides]